MLNYFFGYCGDEVVFKSLALEGESRGLDAVLLCDFFVLRIVFAVRLTAPFVDRG